MMSKLIGIVLVQCMALCASETNTDNQWTSKAIELDNALSQVKAFQSLDQARLRQMAQAFSSQITKMVKDISAAKTVLNVLMEDSVKTQGKMRALQGLSTDVHFVRDQLNRFHYNLSSLISSVQHSVQELQTSFQQQTTAQQALTNQQNQEMVHLSDRIDALDDKNAAQEAKVAQLEEMIRQLNQTSVTTATAGSGETLAGQIREVQETIQAIKSRQDATDDRVNSQMLALRNGLEDVRKDIKNHQLYPFQ